MVDKVLVKTQTHLMRFEDKSRLRRLGFEPDPSHGVWSISIAKLSEGLALPVGAVLDERRVLDSIAGVQPCILQVQGRQMLLRHAEYLAKELNAAGFEWVRALMCSISNHTGVSCCPAPELLLLRSLHGWRAPPMENICSDSAAWLTCATIVVRINTVRHTSRMRWKLHGWCEQLP